MFKLLGISFIILSGFVFGLSIKQGYIKRIETIKSFIYALDILSKELSYKLTPIGDIIEKFATSNAPYSKLFLNLQNMIIENPDEKLSILWKNSFINFGREIHLSSEECLILAELSEIVGQYDVQEQMKSIDYTSERMKALLTQAIDEKNTKGNVYKTFSIAIGAFIAIILI